MIIFLDQLDQKVDLDLANFEEIGAKSWENEAQDAGVMCNSINISSKCLIIFDSYRMGHELISTAKTFRAIIVAIDDIGRGLHSDIIIDYRPGKNSSFIKYKPLVLGGADYFLTKNKKLIKGVGT